MVDGALNSLFVGGTEDWRILRATSTSLIHQLPLHAAGYEGGRKCSAAIPLDSTTDLKALGSKVLKQLVKTHNVECKGATEKADFISCLEQHISITTTHSTLHTTSHITTSTTSETSSHSTGHPEL